MTLRVSRVFAVQLSVLRAFISRFRSLPLELDPATAYDLWAAAYPAQAHNPLTRAEEAAMLELLPDVRGLRALDLACGSGRYARHLKDRGAARVVGLDLSAAMLARARDVHGVLARATMISLPLPSNTFDLITCGLAVGHLSDLNPVLREMARVLKPGGAVVYSDFHPFGHLAGWKRGFRANGRQYSVRHYPHLYAEHHAACLSVGLTIDAVREPCAVDESGRRAWGDIPVALIIRAVKETSHAN